MANRIVGRVVIGAVGALGLLALPATLSAQTAAVPTFTKDVAPIFQNKCESCHRPDSIAPMSLQTYQEARPWARSIRDRVASRNMPPWHIDPSVGIQHYQNDRSLTQKEIDTIVKWAGNGAPQGDPKDMPAPVKWAVGNDWNYASKFGGPPDIIVKSPKYKQKGGAMDAWYKPVSDVPLTEPRWVRAIEMRPGSLKGRKITHHALAYLMQDEKEAIASGLISADNDSGAGLFMEWAVNKEGEIMRPNTGKLLMPGAKMRWDIHYSDGGEDIEDSVEMGIYLYPKGQEPKFRTMLSLYSGVTGGNRNLDIAPNSISVGQNFHVMRKAGRVENFQPHMHLRGKAMMVEAILPNGTAAGPRLRPELRVQLDEQLRVRRRLRAAAAEGHDPQGDRVARQHARRRRAIPTRPVDWLGRPHRRRDGARVDQHHLHGRRRLQQGSRGA